MPIFEGLACVFVHIPKTAGSSIHRFLSERSTGVKLTGRVPATDRARLIEPRNLLDHLVLRDYSLFVDQATLTRSFAFSVVRNPWARLLSLYCFRQMRRADQGLDRLPDFSTWVDRKIRPGSRDVGAVRQRDYLIDDSGAIAVDEICRFESLHEDWDRIRKALDLGPEEIPHLNRSGSLDYRDYYTPPLAKSVGEHFQVDIDTFGYSF